MILGKEMPKNIPEGLCVSGLCQVLKGSSAARRKELQMKPEALCAQPPARAGAMLRCKLSVSLLPDMLAPKGGEILCTCILGFL